MLDNMYFLEIQKHYLNRGSKMELEPVTSQGEAMLRNELKKYMEERPRVIQAIATAREFGDLAENAEYHAARERQSHVEGRIQELNARVSSIRVVDLSKVPTDFVRFGSKVTIVDIETALFDLLSNMNKINFAKYLNINAKIKIKINSVYDIQKGNRVKYLTVDIETDETLTYIIASDLETNPEQGWISYKCPLGKALMGKRVDDIIDFEHNNKEYEIVKIQKVN